MIQLTQEIPNETGRPRIIVTKDFEPVGWLSWEGIESISKYLEEMRKQGSLSYTFGEIYSMDHVWRHCSEETCTHLTIRKRNDTERRCNTCLIRAYKEKDE